jgi:hypothetical protein
MKQQRVETGPMQFGEDWKGVFIRGDNVFALKLALMKLLEVTRHHTGNPYETILEIKTIEGLIRLLESSNQYTGLQPQKMKSFEECFIDD